MKEQDTLQRFMFEHANIRGEIAHLDETYKTIMHQHPYPPMVRRLLGEALISCLLLTGSIKFEGEVSLQFHGDERLPLLLVQCDHHLQVRGFAKYQTDEDIRLLSKLAAASGVREDTEHRTLVYTSVHEDSSTVSTKQSADAVEFGEKPIDYADAFIHGKMVLIINQYNQTQAYQSVVPLRSASMSENLTHYFAQSEQVATQVWLAVNEDNAAGMLLQLMPGQDTLQREQFWEYAVQLGQTITEHELLTLDNPTILHRLYHETELRLYGARNVHFQCRCNPEKMKQVLTILGEQDVQQLVAERGEVEISCDFCNQQYTFDPIDVTLLFRK